MKRVQEKTIWIVFSGDSTLPMLRFLKQGFKHCFAVILQNGRWVTIDPLSHYMEVNVQDIDESFDLPQWLGQRGHRVVQIVPKSPPRRVAPVLPFTCVEAIKRMIGMHSWRIVTPWQLYKALKKQGFGQ